MNDETYKLTLDTLVEELSGVIDEQEELETRLESLKERSQKLATTVLGLANLLGTNVAAELVMSRPDLFPLAFQTDIGITDAVRQVLKRRDMYFTPTIIRAELEKLGFKASEYSNLGASIHAILKRLERKGEVKSKDVNGKTGYMWAAFAPPDEIEELLKAKRLELSDKTNSNR